MAFQHALNLMERLLDVNRRLEKELRERTPSTEESDQLLDEARRTRHWGTALIRQLDEEGRGPATPPSSQNATQRTQAIMVAAALLEGTDAAHLSENIDRLLALRNELAHDAAPLDGD
ncbi:hypothetical protein [Streptomyces sp. FIT100]|uniref:hypothetical protein n=1 Tax=Streptomyces sp. FIT100 TaxID=2837956 RepID=UPI0021C67798|nr:hypothetical protein [Streptomyces sp. FIT100]UUN25529.1 hypothetical protein KK483_03175 [Streptomyces sp. FIT100]